MPPGEEACLCINQEHFLSTYPPMQQRNVAYWWFLTEGQPTIPVLADRNYLLEAGLFLQSSAKGWVKCPKRDLEILIEKSIPTSLPFPPIQKMSPFTWVTTSSASTMAIWRRTGPMVTNGEVICWRTTGKLGFSIGTSSITEVRVWMKQNWPKIMHPEKGKDGDGATQRFQIWVTQRNLHPNPNFLIGNF